MVYRILSLDGGGSWALIQVKVLLDLYGAGATGRQILQDFDMVAANSGGSIVLGGLVEDYPLGKLLALFQDEHQRRAIFSATDEVGDKVLHAITGLGPRYSAEEKLPALQTVLPIKGNIPFDQMMNGIRRTGAARDVHALIVAFDYDRQRARYFRSAAASGAAWGTGDPAKVTLAEAIHASTNAPVNYFDGPATFPEYADRYWDGAISGCNNPVLAAVTEAIVLGQDPGDIVALSIGTAAVVLPWPQDMNNPTVFEQPINDPGLVTDLKKLAFSILDDPPDVATFYAHAMTKGGAGLAHPGPDSRIVRMNPLISPIGTPGAWTAPGGMTAAQFKSLANLEMDAIKQPQVDAITRYADLWLQNKAPNQPIRMNRDTLRAEIGQDTYSAAKAAWAAIK
jgi:patatin-like phospholipase